MNPEALAVAVIFFAAGGALMWFALFWRPQS